MYLRCHQHPEDLGTLGAGSRGGSFLLAKLAKIGVTKFCTFPVMRFLLSFKDISAAEE